MKNEKSYRSDEVTVFNYLLIIPVVFILIGIILVAFLLAKDPQKFRYEMLALLILPFFYFILFFIAPISITFKSNEFTAKYLLRQKTVNWGNVKYIVQTYGYRNSKYCVIYTEGDKEKRLNLPAFKKILKLLEQYSSHAVIDQYKYRDMKKSEYKNQFTNYFGG